MEESVSLDPGLSKLTEDTDALITVVMAKGVAWPMMSTKLAAGNVGIASVIKIAGNAVMATLLSAVSPDW